MAQPQYHLQLRTTPHRRPMNKVMEIVHCHNKGPYLNTIERFHIHTESTKNNHLNDPQTVHPNAIFDTLLETDH
jgi:hypothetical protein